MRTAKCLIIVVALSAIPCSAERRLTNTREANCIIKITVTPDVLPLNPQMVEHLIGSSAVVGKAAQEVLDAAPDQALSFRANVQIEWLGQSIAQQAPAPGRGRTGGRSSRSTGESRDEGYDEMMEQLEEIYGDRYVDQISRGDSTSTDAPGARSPAGPYGGGGMDDGYGRGARGGYGSPAMPGSGMAGRGMGRGMGSMGGMGGMSGMYGSTGNMYAGSQQGTSTGASQSALVKLEVALPESIMPAAEEFLAALVENLRRTLIASHDAHAKELTVLADFAQSRRDQAQANLEIAMDMRSPNRMQIQDQLDTIVDLSVLSPEMPFSEAIECLRNAVEPPLQIVVLWRELLDSCEIEPTTPIDMDGLPQVRLGTALKTLIAAVGGGFSDLSYQIDDDVIIVREEEMQDAPPLPTGPRTGDDIEELRIRRRQLAERLQQLEMNFATGEARRRAIEQQIVQIRDETARKMDQDAISREMQSLVEMSQKHVTALAKQVEAGMLSESDLAQAKESLTRARIELARRREELADSAGGTRLRELNSELSRLAIDTAEKRAELEFLRRQLAETEDELARASTFDPKAARIRIAREALNIVEAQLSRLRVRQASLQPPTVTVIGGR